MSTLCAEELNLRLKVKYLTSSQGAVGLRLRGTDFLLTNTLDLTFESNQEMS